MTKHLFLISTLVGFLSVTTTAQSSPASIDYVNTRIKEAVDAIQQQWVQENKKMESKINTIPVVALHYIGESYQGGLVFWVDETKQHGLIAAKMDANQGMGIQWQNGASGDKITNARANGIYAGLSNTHLIVAQQTIDDQEGAFAALSARSFSVLSDGVSPCVNNEVCYGNWYLPSLIELNLVRTNLYARGLGNLSENTYWTSTEINVNQVVAIDLPSGDLAPTDKSSTEPKVRAIHAF